MATTFDGNGIATRESQVRIREAEFKIVQGSGDEYQKARALERLYADNGLEYGSFKRKDNVQYDDSPQPKGSAFGWLVGMILVGVICYALKYM